MFDVFFCKFRSHIFNVSMKSIHGIVFNRTFQVFSTRIVESSLNRFILKGVRCLWCRLWALALLGLVLSLPRSVVWVLLRVAVPFGFCSCSARWRSAFFVLVLLLADYWIFKDYFSPLLAFLFCLSAVAHRLDC